MTSRRLADLLEDTPPEQRAQLIDAICDRGNLSSEVRGAMQGLVKAIAAVEELERARGGFCNLGGFGRPLFCGRVGMAASDQIRQGQAGIGRPPPFARFGYADRSATASWQGA